MNLEQAIANIEAHADIDEYETSGGLALALSLLRAMQAADPAAVVGQMLGSRWEVSAALGHPVGCGLFLSYQRGKFDMLAARDTDADLWDLLTSDSTDSNLTTAQMVTAARAAAARWEREAGEEG